MAVTGVIMLLFLIAHMIGNLKIFAGRAAFNHYSAWLRTFGEPALPRRTFLTLLEIVLVLCVAAHAIAAAQLWRRSLRARPIGYAGRRVDYSTRTMRWGGVILALFVIYHLLDLTFRVANPLGRAHDSYDNVVAGFSRWPITAVYTVALLALALHVRHGVASALTTLGVTTRHGAVIATGTAALLIGGFLCVPYAVLCGAVR